MNAPHLSVMEKEFLSFFEGRYLKVFFEGTVGAGGHAYALLAAHPEIERYIGCDRDPEALAIAEERLAPWKEKVTLIHGNFSDLDLFLEDQTPDGFFLISECRLCS